MTFDELRGKLATALSAEIGKEKLWVLRSRGETYIDGISLSDRRYYTGPGSSILEVSGFPSGLIRKARELCQLQKPGYWISAVSDGMRENDSTYYLICAQFDGDSMFVPLFLVSLETVEEFMDSALHSVARCNTQTLNVSA